MEPWLVQGLEGSSIPRLLPVIFVNLKSTDKRYRRKKLKEKHRYPKNNFKTQKRNMTLIISNKI